MRSFVPNDVSIAVDLHLALFKKAQHVEIDRVGEQRVEVRLFQLHCQLAFFKRWPDCRRFSVMRIKSSSGPTERRSSIICSAAHLPHDTA